MTEKIEGTQQLDIWRAKLAMHGNEIPCFFETLAEDPCTKLAVHLVYYEHLFGDIECETPAIPVCTEHLRLLKFRSGIWSSWCGEAPLDCSKCANPVEIMKVEKI
jgi:hypothetical protein